MLFNAGKTKFMVVSRSRTDAPTFPDLQLGGVLVENVPEVNILGDIFHQNMTFENYVRSVATCSSQKIGLMKLAWRTFGSVEVFQRCFNCFVLPLLEYCSQVWFSAADCHFKLLDSVVRRAASMMDGTIPSDLSHRRVVSALCLMYKYFFREGQPLVSFLPQRFVPVRSTRRTDALHSYAMNTIRCRTVQ
jgi:hypothetical protein